MDSGHKSLLLVAPPPHSDLNKGNLVNWEDSSWYLDEGMEWIDMLAEDVCILPRPMDIIFPEYRTYEDMLLLCNKLSGSLSVTDGQTKQDDLINEFKRKLPEDFTGYQSCKLSVDKNHDPSGMGCYNILFSSSNVLGWL